MGRPFAPQPEGFAEYAATRNIEEIASRFRICREQVRRHVNSMPDDWKAARRDVLRVRQVEAGKKNVLTAIKAAVAANTTPMPDGFVEMLLTTTNVAVGNHFGISNGALYRMIKRLPVETQSAISAAGKERKRAASSRNALKAAAKSYQVRAERVAAPKIKKQPRVRPTNWGFSKPTDIAPARGGLAENAAQFLRRRNSVVCRGETINNALKGCWIVGARPAMTLDAMIALAKAGGWNPDAWWQAA